MKQFLITSPEWRTKKELEKALKPFNDVVEEVGTTTKKIDVRA